MAGPTLNPFAKLYAITITSVSVVLPAVGGIEALGLLAGHFHPKGGFWNLINTLNGNFGLLGYGIVGLFAMSWTVCPSRFISGAGSTSWNRNGLNPDRLNR